jgi:sulfur carrier protein ThiS
MQVQVKLYGTLGKQVAGYDHQSGLTLEVEEGATVADLIVRIGIPLKRVGVVSLDGRLAGRGTPLSAGTMVKVFHPIFGG